MQLMDDLGLTVHPEKSVIIPTQCIEFVGFIINSVDRTVRLSPHKAVEIKNLCFSLLKQQTVIIRDFAKLTGKLVAADPGVLYAGAHYKSMEVEKDFALKWSKWDFDAHMKIVKSHRNVCIGGLKMYKQLTNPFHMIHLSEG